MKNLSILTFLLFLATATQAQSYRTAMGVRLGTDFGITVQQKILKFSTIEGIFQSSLHREEIGMTLLYEKHNRIISKRLNFYLGAGFHKNWVTGETADYDPPSGFTGVAGIEFTLGRLNFSYDFKPAVNLWGGEKKFYSQTGVSLRYVLIKKKKRKINWKFWDKKK